MDIATEGGRATSSTWCAALMASPNLNVRRDGVHGMMRMVQGMARVPGMAGAPGMTVGEGRPANGSKRAKRGSCVWAGLHRAGHLRRQWRVGVWRMWRVAHQPPRLGWLKLMYLIPVDVKDYLSWIKICAPDPVPTKDFGESGHDFELSCG